MNRSISFREVQIRPSTLGRYTILILVCIVSILLARMLIISLLWTTVAVFGFVVTLLVSKDIGHLPLLFLILIPLYPRISVIRISGIGTPIRIEDFVIITIFSVWVCWLLLTNRLSIPVNKVVKGRGFFLTVLAISTALGVERCYILGVIPKNCTIEDLRVSGKSEDIFDLGQFFATPK